jgi:hypothetical protein
MYHFDCITSDVDDECEYLIIDRALEFRVKVPLHLLMREPFDLIGWYKKRVAKAINELDITINGPPLEEDLPP